MPEYGCQLHAVVMHVKEISFTKGGTESSQPFIRFQLANYVAHYLYMLGTTTIQLSVLTSSGVVATCTLERIDLGLAVTEVNSKKVQKQENKNIKNVKECRDGMPKSMQTRMLHGSKGQHIGKAAFLHLFHTTVRQHA